jgi:hypothetical protein
MTHSINTRDDETRQYNDTQLDDTMYNKHYDTEHENAQNVETQQNNDTWFISNQNIAVQHNDSHSMTTLNIIGTMAKL